MAARRARATALNWHSTMWWGSRPASSVTCRHRWAWKARVSSTCRVSEPAYGTLTFPEPDVRPPPLSTYSWPAGSPRCRQYGRPETSTTAWARASSNGTSASPKRLIPRLSPRACRMAWPRAMAVSSTVWWPSMCQSPVLSTPRSISECLANAVSMWSKNPTPVETCA